MLREVGSGAAALEVRRICYDTLIAPTFYDMPLMRVTPRCCYDGAFRARHHAAFSRYDADAFVLYDTRRKICLPIRVTCRARRFADYFRCNSCHVFIRAP